MEFPKGERGILEVFNIFLIYKSVVSILQMIGGALFLIVSHNWVTSTVAKLTQEELIEDPRDFIAGHILRASESFSVSAQVFFGIYLLMHGIVKSGLVYGLWRRKLWIYPVATGFFLLSVSYQFARFFITHSPWLIVLGTLDLIYIWIIMHEFLVLRKSGN